MLGWLVHGGFVPGPGKLYQPSIPGRLVVRGGARGLAALVFPPRALAAPAQPWHESPPSLWAGPGWPAKDTRLPALPLLPARSCVIRGHRWPWLCSGGRNVGIRQHTHHHHHLSLCRTRRSFTFFPRISFESQEKSFQLKSQMFLPPCQRYRPTSRIGKFVGVFFSLSFYLLFPIQNCLYPL